MFFGEYRCKCDAKGRVLIPSALRKQNEAQDQSSFILTNSRLDHALLLYTKEDFTVRAKALYESVSRESLEGSLALHKFHRSVVNIQLDGSDRILLNKKQLNRLQTSGELVFVGQGNCIEIWDAALYDSMDEELSI